MMTTTQRRTTKKIAIRKVADGYRYTGNRRTFRFYAGAFNAAWQTCAETGASLYAITPEGKWVLLLDGKTIRELEGRRH